LHRCRTKRFGASIRQQAKVNAQKDSSIKNSRLPGEAKVGTIRATMRQSERHVITGDFGIKNGIRRRQRIGAIHD
ncbi:MAG: hypothetical protein AAFP28_00810, partial [Pseudomonadota bacterium]